jgi:hypothetical protein
VVRASAAALACRSSARRSRPALAASVRAIVRSRAASNETAGNGPKDSLRKVPAPRTRKATSQVFKPLGATRTAKPRHRKSVIRYATASGRRPSTPRCVRAILPRVVVATSTFDMNLCLHFVATRSQLHFRHEPLSPIVATRSQLLRWLADNPGERSRTSKAQ